MHVSLEEWILMVLDWVNKSLRASSLDGHFYTFEQSFPPVLSLAMLPESTQMVRSGVL